MTFIKIDSAKVHHLCPLVSENLEHHFLFAAAKSAGGKVATKAGAYGGSEVGSIIGELLF